MCTFKRITYDYSLLFLLYPEYICLVAFDQAFYFFFLPEFLCRIPEYKSLDKNASV